MAAGEQACARVDAVHPGLRFEPAAHGRATVQREKHAEPEAEVAGLTPIGYIAWSAWLVAAGIALVA